MKRLIYCLFLLLLPCFTLAQEVVSWPLDPADIFARGIEIVDSREVDTPIPLQAAGKTYDIDDEASAIWIFDQALNSWGSYSFPEGIEHIYQQVEQRSDGSLLLNLSPYGERLDFERVWILDPHTGEYTQPEPICEASIPDLAGEGRWVVVEKPQPHLCFTEDGDATDNLPSLPESYYWLAIDTSPSKDWVVLTDFYCRGNVYAYQISTNTLTPLGKQAVNFWGGTRCHVDWLDDTFFSCLQMTCQSGRTV